MFLRAISTDFFDAQNLVIDLFVKFFSGLNGLFAEFLGLFLNWAEQNQKSSSHQQSHQRNRRTHPYSNRQLDQCRKHRCNQAEYLLQAGADMHGLVGDQLNQIRAGFGRQCFPVWLADSIINAPAQIQLIATQIDILLYRGHRSQYRAEQHDHNIDRNDHDCALQIRHSHKRLQ